MTLSVLRGASNVLLAFFPLAFTRVCTSEMCAFSEDFEVFAGHGVEVIPMSVDSVPTLKEFKQKYTMNVDMLSDFKCEAFPRVWRAPGGYVLFQPCLLSH